MGHVRPSETRRLEGGCRFDNGGGGATSSFDEINNALFRA
jgi:hypothetical protein